MHHLRAQALPRDKRAFRRKPITPKERPRGENVVDLMDALRQRVSAAQRRRARLRRSPPRKPSKAADRSEGDADADRRQEAGQGGRLEENGTEIPPKNRLKVARPQSQSVLVFHDRCDPIEETGDLPNSLVHGYKRVDDDERTGGGLSRSGLRTRMHPDLWETSRPIRRFGSAAHRAGRRRETEATPSEVLSVKPVV